MTSHDKPPRPRTLPDHDHRPATTAPRLDAGDPVAAERAMRPVLEALQLPAADLRLRRISAGANGHHLRYDRCHGGLDVVGGDLVIHVDPGGRVLSVTGALPGLPADSGVGAITAIDAAAIHALSVADPRYAGMATSPPRKVYLVVPDDGSARLAYETVATGMRGQDPVRDKVYIDAASGAVLAAHPQLHFADSAGAVHPGLHRR